MPVAVECKWRTEGFNSRNTVFRTQYPEGSNYVVTADAKHSEIRDYDGVSVRFIGRPELVPAITVERNEPESVD